MTTSLPHQPCVVAIDGSDDVRHLYRELLGDEGYAVATLACAEATCDGLRQHRPDVVLLDCFIGCRPSGWELLQVLSLDPELKQVPVVVCTTDARMLREDSRASLDDAIHVLAKPFDVQELLGAIEAALGRPGSCASHGTRSEERA